jgi:thioredoxin reductase (NADPH)
MQTRQSALLESAHYRRRDGGLESLKTHHLFLFIGADPNTNWLSTYGVSLDPRGFVLVDTD